MTFLQACRVPNRLFVTVGILLLSTGCTLDHVVQGIYEGSQARNELLTPPGERIEKRDYPTHGAYEQQRNEILQRDGGTDAYLH
jgi:hypothetical protein